MLIPICQVGEVKAYSGDVKITRDGIDTWVRNFGKYEKVPVGMGHLDLSNYKLSDTDKPAYCWISGLYGIGDYCFAYCTDWTPEGREAALNNEFKNFSIETTGGDEDRIRYVAALGAYDSAVDFKLPDGQRFQPFDFTQGALGEEGRLMLAAALGAEPLAMPYKSPPPRITKLFSDEKGPKIWMEAFNSAYEKYKDEARASKIAWGAVENAGYEKGKDEKWHKTKKAAEAAHQGGGMSFKQKVLAAMKDVMAKLESEPEEAAAPAELNVVMAAAPPVGEPAKMPEVALLAARLDKSEAEVKAVRVELAATRLATEAKELCLAAKASPRFEPVVAQLLAAIPGDVMITIDETGEKKMTARECFKAILTDKGTRKLDDPIKLTEPPKKKAVEFIAVGDEGSGSVSLARQTEIAQEARAEALAAGKGDDPTFIKNLMVAKMNAEVAKCQ